MRIPDYIIPNISGKIAGDAMLSDAQKEEFDTISKQMIKWLNDNFHPHVTVVITPTTSQLLESVSGLYSEEFILD